MSLNISGCMCRGWGTKVSKVPVLPAGDISVPRWGYGMEWGGAGTILPACRETHSPGHLLLYQWTLYERVWLVYSHLLTEYIQLQFFASITWKLFLLSSFTSSSWHIAGIFEKVYGNSWVLLMHSSLVWTLDFQFGDMGLNPGLGKSCSLLQGFKWEKSVIFKEHVSTSYDHRNIFCNFNVSAILLRRQGINLKHTNISKERQ